MQKVNNKKNSIHAYELVGNAKEANKVSKW